MVAALTAAVLTAASPGACFPSRRQPSRQFGRHVGYAQEVPGMARLNHGPLAAVDSVSCTGPGDCTAGGNYGNRIGG